MRTLSPAVKVRCDRNDPTLALENLASEPVRLMDVRPLEQLAGGYRTGRPCSAVE